ncbi:MAG: hypothetical protein M0R06_05650 [Sphaerochaeta sp.]|nr:hypothetical protein [Sphaerochaeta sp.]
MRQDRDAEMDGLGLAMSITIEQLQSIKRNRRVYFESGEGRQVLRETLESFGLFADWTDWKTILDRPEQNLRLMIEGLLLLRSLGVLVPENFDHTIEALASVPLPTDIVRSDTHGSTG